MISEKLQGLINQQIGKELYSSYMYMGMAAWFEENSLEGFGSWMRVQTQEESCHAMIFYNFLIQSGGHVVLPAIDQPPCDYKGSLDIFQRGLNHEQYVTALINSMMDVAVEEKNHAAHSFLNWFVDEQVEEEDNFTSILGKIKLCENSGGGGMFMIDKELSARVFALPAPLVGKISVG